MAKAKTIKKVVNGTVYEMAVDEAKEFEASRKAVPEKQKQTSVDRSLITDDVAQALARAVEADANLEAIARILIGTEKLMEMMEGDGDA